MRTVHSPDCGGPNHDYCVFQPAVLYIDVFNRGAQVYIENGLRTILNDLPPCADPYGCAIPENRNWDRYDINAVPGGAHVPFARGSIPGSNNGMTLGQVLGYRAILVNTADLSTNAALHDEDYMLFDTWLRSSDCDANLHRQALLFNGDGIGEIDPLENPYGAQFMSQTLGAELLCDAFNGSTGDPGCGSESSSYCVRLLPSEGPFSPEIDVDAWGNSCPNRFGFHVYSPVNGGTGNRLYYAEDDAKEMSFAQILNENLAANRNYRTVLDGVSWHHLSERNPGGSGEERCPRDLPSIVSAEVAEIGATLKWCFDVDDFASLPRIAPANDLGECQGTWDLGGTGVDEDVWASPWINRLYQNRPNPSATETTIRFSLAREGPVEIVIYDVNGRHVRTLIDQRTQAGLHSLVWDRTNDKGVAVGSGVYWSQMTAACYSSTRKMIVIR